MRIYNYKIIKSAGLYRIYDKKGDRLMTLDLKYKPTKNRLKRIISKNLHDSSLLPF